MKKSIRSNTKIKSSEQSHELEADPSKIRAIARKQRLLRDRVLRVIKQLTGINDLEPDDDGDLSVMFREIPLYLMVRSDPPRMQFLSPILTHVQEKNLELLTRINTINSLEPRLQVFLAKDCVYAKREIRLYPFHRDQISNTLMDFSNAAESAKASLDMAYLDSKGNPGIILSSAIH